MQQPSQSELGENYELEKPIEIELEDGTKSEFNIVHPDQVHKPGRYCEVKHIKPRRNKRKRKAKQDSPQE